MPPEITTDASLSSRREIALLAAIVAGGAALRMALISMTVVVSKDGSSAIRHAAEVARGHLEVALDHSQHPLFAFVMALPIKLGLAPLAAAELVMLVSGTLTIPIVWRLARDCCDARAALLAAVFAATHWIWLEGAATVISEPLYVLFVAIAAAAGWRAVRDGRPRAHLLFGAAGALAYLTRPEGLVLPAIVAIFLLERIVRDRAGRRRRIAAAVLGGALALALMAPYVAYLSRDGEFALTRKKSRRESQPPTLAMRAAIAALQVEQESALAGATPPPASAPAPLPARTFAELFEALTSAYSPPLSLLALALVIAQLSRFAARRAAPTGGWHIHVYLAALFTGHLILYSWHIITHGYLASRHAASVAFLIMPWAATAIVLVFDRVARRSRAGGLLVMVILVGLTVGMNLYKGARRHGSDKSQERAAAALIAAQPGHALRAGRIGEPLATSPLIMGNLPRVAFYSGLRFTTPPDREEWMKPEWWRAILIESLTTIDRPDFFAIDRDNLGIYVEVLQDPGDDRLVIELLSTINAMKSKDDVLIYRIEHREPR